MSDLSGIRRFNKITRQISIVNYLIYLVAGLVLFAFLNFDSLFSTPQCGGGVPTNYSYRTEVAADFKTSSYLLGERLFKANCTACHKVHEKLVGPSLAGVSDKYERKWLYRFIRNSQEMVREGNPAAIQVFNEYKGSVMTAFPSLSNSDIDAILEYIEGQTTTQIVVLP